MAVRGIDDQAVDAAAPSASRRARIPCRRPKSRRRRAGARRRPWRRWDAAVAFSMSLTVMRPTQAPMRRRPPPASRCGGGRSSRRASSWPTPSPTVTTFRVMSSVTGCRESSAKRTSRLVRMPTSYARPAVRAPLDHRNAGDRGAPHQGERVGEGGVGKDGDRIDHHAALEPLDLAHLLGLLVGSRFGG